MSTDDGRQPLLGLLLRLANQQWSTEMDAALETLGITGLTVAHAQVMPFVPEEGIRIGALAQKAKVRKQSMAQAVEQLVRSGWVERRADPQDGRASLVFLTDRGRQLRPSSRVAGSIVESRWADRLGPDDVEQLRALLARLVEWGNT